MRRALMALVGTIVGVYWLVTFKVTSVQNDVPVVSAPSARPSTSTRTAEPAARAGITPAPVVATGVTGGTPFIGSTVDTIWGPVQVEIGVSGGKVVDVEALQLPSDRSRSARISQYSAPILRTEAIQAQSAQVDVVTGATYTSRAYALSLDSAIKKAQAQ